MIRKKTTRVNAKHSSTKTPIFWRYSIDRGRNTTSTCLDDSCSHEYHQLRLFNNSKVDRNYGGGWYLISHKSGVRCDELRGGGSPPCL